MDNSVFNSAGYKRTRAAYVLQAMFEYFIALLVSDAFIAKLLVHLGVSEANIGVITTIISLAMAFQLGSLFFASIKASAKKLTMLFSTISQVLFALLYLIPFFTVGAGSKRVLAVVCIVAAYFSLYVVSPMHYKWAYKFVAAENRARFSATKEMVSLAAGSAFSIIIGLIIDHYEGLDNIEGAFLFVASATLIISVCNFICMVLMKEEPDYKSRKERKKEAQLLNASEVQGEKKSQGFRDVMKNTFGNKQFCACLLALCMWDVAKYFQLGFMGVFKNNLIDGSGVFDNPMVAVQIINLSGHFVRLVLSYPIARYSDRRGYVKGMQIGLIMAATAYLVNCFTSTSTWYLIIIYTILQYSCYVGITANANNMMYSYVDNAYVAKALAIKNCIVGLCGFGSALVASRVMAFVQSHNNTFFGLNVFGQQVLSFVSLIITVATIVFVKLVVSKQKRVEDINIK